MTLQVAKWALLTSTCLLSAACGGGGGGSSSETPQAPAQFDINVTVTGLRVDEWLTLTLNGGSETRKTGTGVLSFPRRLAVGTSYTVAVVDSALTTHCTLSGASGTVSSSNISVSADCESKAIDVRGSVNGLLSDESLELTLNGAAPVEVSGDANTFLFPASLNWGDHFELALNRIPDLATCEFAESSGQVTAYGLSNLLVTCRPLPLGFRLAAPVQAGRSDRDSNPRDFADTSTGVIFSAQGKLWRVESAGAGVVLDTAAGALNSVNQVDGGVVFNVANFETELIEIWFSDGTTNGTTTSGSLGIGPSSAFTQGASILLLGNSDQFGKEIYRMAAGGGPVSLVRDINPGIESGVYGFGYPDTDAGLVYFAAFNGVDGYEIWVTDGTDAGTRSLTDNNPGPEPGFPPEIYGILNGELLYSTSSTGDVVRGVSATGPDRVVMDFEPDGPDQVSCFFENSGVAYFSGKSFELDGGGFPEDTNFSDVWLTDGTAPGTKKLAGPFPDIDGGACGFVAHQGRVFFAAPQDSDPEHSSLWQSNGTRAGTLQIDDDIWVPNRAGSFSLFPTPAGLVYPKYTGDYGIELWRYNGAISELLLDINPGPGNAFTQSNLRGTTIDDQIYLAANDGATGFEPWVSDGTRAGSSRVANLNTAAKQIDDVEQILGAVDEGLLFVGCADPDDCELWVSDLTETGTRQVTELNPDGSLQILSSVQLNGRLFFNAAFPVKGTWITDGSAAGTYQFDPSGMGANIVSNDRLFTAFSDSGGFYRVVSTDGTAEGTDVLLTTIWPPTSFGYFAGEVYFLIQGAGELWKTNGSAEGTSLVAEIETPANGYQNNMVATDDYLYFVADVAAGNNWEVWRTDGSNAGTQQIADLNPGIASSNPQRLITFANAVYFIAEDAAGQGIFVSRGETIEPIYRLATELDDAATLEWIWSTPNSVLFSANIDASTMGTMLFDGTQTKELQLRGTGSFVISEPSRTDLTYFKIRQGWQNGASIGYTDGLTVGADAGEFNGSIEQVFEVKTGPWQGVYLIASTAETGKEIWQLDNLPVPLD